MLEEEYQLCKEFYIQKKIYCTKGWKMLEKKTTFVNDMQGLIYTEAVGLF